MRLDEVLFEYRNAWKKNGINQNIIADNIEFYAPMKVFTAIPAFKSDLLKSSAVHQSKNFWQ